jgi:UDP-N-acetylglucosamine 2-epimerase (hydrolysing)
MRFEYYLTLLESSQFIIGNSSSAIMEAPYFNVPAINIGDRQLNRHGVNTTINAPFVQKEIFKSIKKLKKIKLNKKQIFGKGDSAKKIIKILKSKKFKNVKIQKLYKNLK